MRKVILIACSSALALGFLLFVLEKTHVINLHNRPITETSVPKPVNTIDFSPATPKDNTNNDQVKQDSSKTSPNSSSNLSATITRATQLPDTKTLVVRALIEGATSGTCTLELSQNENVGFTKQVSISQQNNVFTCNGFDVPRAELPGVGEWTIKLTVNDGTTTVSASQNITIEK